MTIKVFVNGVENHNNAFRAISDRSVYCKVVHADDRLMPFALTKMVKLAEQHPNVGIVGSYGQSNEGIQWKGLPEDVTVLSGRRPAGCICCMIFISSGAVTTFIKELRNPIAAVRKFQSALALRSS